QPVRPHRRASQSQKCRNGPANPTRPAPPRHHNRSRPESRPDRTRPDQHPEQRSPQTLCDGAAPRQPWQATPAQHPDSANTAAQTGEASAKASSHPYTSHANDSATPYHATAQLEHRKWPAHGPSAPRYDHSKGHHLPAATRPTSRTRLSRQAMPRMSHRNQRRNIRHRRPAIPLPQRLAHPLNLRPRHSIIQFSLTRMRQLPLLNSIKNARTRLPVLLHRQWHSANPLTLHSRHQRARSRPLIQHNRERRPPIPQLTQPRRHPRHTRTPINNLNTPHTPPRRHTRAPGRPLTPHTRERRPPTPQLTHPTRPPRHTPTPINTLIMPHTIRPLRNSRNRRHITRRRNIHSEHHPLTRHRIVIQTTRPRLSRDGGIPANLRPNA